MSNGGYPQTQVSKETHVKVNSIYRCENGLDIYAQIKGEMYLSASIFCIDFETKLIKGETWLQLKFLVISLNCIIRE